MTPDALATLHAGCFAETPPPWTAAAFAAALAHPGSLAVFADGGAALGRVAADEAEVLTLAVMPEARGRGLGQMLVAALEAAARNRGAEVMFLEVAETNAPARRLYARLGYAAAGRRPRYYTRHGAEPVDALVLRKALVALDAKPEQGPKTI